MKSALLIDTKRKFVRFFSLTLAVSFMAQVSGLGTVYANHAEDDIARLYPGKRSSVMPRAFSSSSQSAAYERTRKALEAQEDHAKPFWESLQAFVVGPGLKKNADLGETFKQEERRVGFIDGSPEAGKPAGAGGGRNIAPAVSSISSDSVDIDSSKTGVQIYNTVAVTYSATASDSNNDPLSWTWSYSLNGSANVLAGSGTGPQATLTYDYYGKTAGTYAWTLKVSDGKKTASKTTSTEVLLDQSVNWPPAINPISASVADADTSVPGYQVYDGAVVTYAAAVSDPNGNAAHQWQWSYKVNGGPEVVHSQGAGAAQSAVYDYTGRSGSTYEWTLRVSDGLNAVEKKQTTQVISAPPVTSRPYLFLDFDGDFASNWGSYSNITTPSYDMDGNTSEFNAAEITSISEIVARTMEKFSPFNLDIYTNRIFSSFNLPTFLDGDPASFANKQGLQVIIGGTSGWLGQSAGGVAYVGSFYNSLQNAVYVFSDALSDAAKYIAEAVAHEAGHAFGLQHQSAWSGTTKTAEYRGSTDGGLTAPIMGNSYSSARGLWSNGTSSSCSTCTQDDLAIITNLSTNGFGYRLDDFGSTAGTASSFELVTGSSVRSTGIIERMSDADYFRFDTLGGSVSFTAAVAQYGAMLDLRLELRDANDNLIAVSDPANTSNKVTLGGSLATTLSGGTYYVVVRSHGSYGDLGQYTLDGILPV